ncbi:DUF1552 domain-containing protein [Sandaracinus amylolyticus]|uniref:DUF1552 domain-containing protein n=1 Tax=Sandaracinus amylolyticus TaxID=927083 RepID=UPI001F45CD68|nr:DUF1552 domain-containing protein [Sandaracinus amylolyticus]UJR86874.1 Hypothetical protein I5071_89750 [Sandaracinus amylolyticus]
MLARRRFLQGLALTAAAAPFTSFGLRALAGPGDPPLRLVLWPMMNGADPSHFWPSSVGATSLVTEPLRAFADQITYVRGLNVQGSDNHFAVRSIFTGAPVPDYLTADPRVRSLDQVVSAHVDASSPTPVRSVHLGVRPADSYDFYQLYGRSTLFFTPDGPVDYEASPVAAYDRLFAGGPVDPGPMEPAVDVEAEALAITEAELGDLGARVNGLTTEQEKIAQHLAAVRALRTTGEMPPPTTVSCETGTLASVERLRSALQGNPREAYKDEHFSNIFDAQVDVMARAMTCGLTRVATLQAGSADGNVLVPVNGGQPHHNTSHGDQALFARCQAWYMEKLARFLTAINVPDPLDPSGNTVLANTCVVVMAECLPSSHSSMGVPTMIIGRLGGRLRTNAIIDAAGATNRHVLKSICRAFGVSDADSGHFGGDELREVRS